MISSQELNAWAGFSWDEVQKWLDSQKVDYRIILWEPDERSQFQVSLNSYYVMKFAIENGKIVVYLAGKMIGRKSNL